jgi:ComEC/Rec2-related protein
MNLPPYKSFRLAVVLFLFGLFVSPILGLNGYFIEVLFISLLLLGSGIFWKEARIIFVSILFLGLSWGVSADFFASSEIFLPTLDKETVVLEGAVVSFPEFKKKDQRMFLQVDQICKNSALPDESSHKILNTINKEDCKVVDEKILLVVPLSESVDYGQQLRLVGKLTKPRSFRDFDYAQYLERFGVQMILRKPSSIELLSNTGGNLVIRTAKKLRNYFEFQLQRVLSEPHSTLVMGILLGVKKELPTDLKQDFRIAGLQHVLVVSGSNVSFVVLAITLLCASLGRWASFCISVMAVGFFVLMTGADPPVIRAALMGGTVALAAAMGRLSDGTNLLLFSALIIGVFAPQMVQADLGFLLSFSATLGIIILTPIFSRLLDILSQRFIDLFPVNSALEIDVGSNFPFLKKFRLILAVLLAAQIGVFPVLTLFFHEFSLWTFPANILVEPLIPLIMIFGLISIVSGMILPLIGAKFFSIPAFVLTQGLIWIGNIFGQFGMVVIPVWLSWISLFVFVGVCLWSFFSTCYEQLQANFEREVYGIDT